MLPVTRLLVTCDWEYEDDYLCVCGSGCCILAQAHTHIVAHQLVLFIPVIMSVLASRLDARLLKNGVVIDGVSPISVVYIAPEVEQPESAEGYDSGTDTASDANSGTRRTQTAARPARRGVLSIKLAVRGHFSRDLNVDFDYIVQDSINRDSLEMRKQLLTYNNNCRNQNVKVKNEGFTVDDFSEVHTNTGVERPRSSLNKREQQKLDGTLKNEQAFSTSCERERVLPEYFETSLGAIKLKTELGTYVKKEGVVSPLLVAVGVLVVGLFALCTGYFLLRRGEKENEDHDCFEDTPSMRDPTNLDNSKQNLESYDEELREYETEMSSRKEGHKEGRKSRTMGSLDDSTIATIGSEYSVSRKQRGHSTRGNMQDAEAFGGSSRSFTSRNAVPRVVNMGTDWDSASEKESRSSRELFKMTVGACSDRSLYSGGGGGSARRSVSASQRSGGRRNSLPARGLDNISEEDSRASPVTRRSRNAVPKIIDTDYGDGSEDSQSSDSSSSDSSSTSSSS